MAESMYLSNQAYISLKRLILIILPGLGSLYFVLWAIFDLPAVEWVLGALMLVIFVLGVTLQSSSKRYYADNKIGGGEIVILTNDDGKQVYSLDLDDDPSNLINLNEVRFQVRKPRN
jgi:hypothetical protein